MHVTWCVGRLGFPLFLAKPSPNFHHSLFIALVRLACSARLPIQANSTPPFDRPYTVFLLKVLSILHESQYHRYKAKKTLNWRSLLVHQDSPIPASLMSNTVRSSALFTALPAFNARLHATLSCRDCDC